MNTMNKSSSWTRTVLRVAVLVLAVVVTGPLFGQPKMNAMPKEVLTSLKLQTQPSRGKVKTNKKISVDCKLLKGSDLAKALGFPGRLGKARAVYAIGFVRNSTAKTAYVRFSIDGGDTIPGGIAEVTVGMVPPRGLEGEAFLVRLSNLVFGEDDFDVDKIKPVIHILETKYK